MVRRANDAPEMVAPDSPIQSKPDWMGHPDTGNLPSAENGEMLGHPGMCDLPHILRSVRFG